MVTEDTGASAAGNLVETLVRRAQSGDDDAFAAIVRAYQNIAIAYATSILGDLSLAEDVAQESFLHAYCLLTSLREPAAFPGWFRRIVFKQCDRATRRHRHRLTYSDVPTEVADQAPLAEERLEREQRQRSLRVAIATLSMPEQQVILLYYMGEQSQKDIASFLGITTNTVKTRLYSARKRLKAHMDEIEKGLGESRPSTSSRFEDAVQRLIQPEALKQNKPWPWSAGIGTDVWTMFCACMEGDLDTVRLLVERDPTLVRCHYEYRTPLSFAVRANHLHVAAYLLDHGASEISLGDPKEMARDRGYVEMERLLEAKYLVLRGASEKGEAIAKAIRDRDLEAVGHLLDDDPSLVLTGDARSNQPIHWAVMTRNNAMIDLVLDRGADMNARRGDGALPIHLTNGDYDYRGWRDVPETVSTTPDEVYRHLVSRGATVDLGMAAYKGDVDRVRAILAQDPGAANRLSPYNSYYIGCGAPLKNAAAGGNLEIVKLLLAHGADPNLPEEGIAPQGHALYSAVAGGHYDIARLLLDHGAFPNPPVESSADAVWITIRAGDRRMLELLGSYGAVMDVPYPLDGKVSYADIQAAGIELPLRILAYYGDNDAVVALLARDARAADDPEALTMAANRAHFETVRVLLRHRPDLARRVTVSKPRDIAEFLFAHGMDANRPDWLRRTPLHHFASRNDVESAALFLDHGAHIHARDEEQRSTPLALAAMHGHARMVEFLLRRGAETRLPDDPPWATPLEWAKRRNHEKVVKLLEDFDRHGALPKRDAVYYERIAQDLVTAFDTGERSALDNIRRHFGLERQLAWDRAALDVQVRRLRSAIGEQLESMRLPRDPSGRLPLAHARLLVARAEGSVDWTDLLDTSHR